MSSNPHIDEPDTVSVIIPAYNAAPYIADAIDSVLSQTRPADEIIVVDDGSTDDTIAIVRRYGDRVILLQQRNRGPAAARNTGLRAARGEYVAFLDADDVWTDRNLEFQIGVLTAHPEYVLTYGLARRFVGAPSPDLLRAAPAHDLWPHGDVSEALIRDTIWATCGAVVRRRILARTGGFDELLRVGEDYDLWLRIAALGPVGYVPYYLGAIRLHPDSTTRSHPFRTVPPEVRVIRRHLQRMPRLRKRIGRRVLRRRLAKCYLDLSFHDLQRNILAGSLLHWGVAVTMVPAQAKTISFYAAGLARCILESVVGLRFPAERTEGAQGGRTC